MNGHPVATVAFYGPDNKVATKLVCGIVREQGGEVETMKKWFSENDMRKSEKIFHELLAFTEDHAVKSIVMVEQIFGCPHEEGIDYPEGESCPDCSYWKDRDRFIDEMLH